MISLWRYLLMLISSISVEFKLFVYKRSTAVQADSFKKLPDELQTEISAKVLLICQSTKGTSSDSLWNICLRKVIQGRIYVYTYNIIIMDKLCDNQRLKTVDCVIHGITDILISPIYK